MAKAGTVLAAGASIAPQSSEAVTSAAAVKKRGGRPAPVLDALSKPIHSRALSASEAAYLQVTNRCIPDAQKLHSAHPPCMQLEANCKAHYQSQVWCSVAGMACMRPHRAEAGATSLT
jgi:hypothetical protein